MYTNLNLLSTVLYDRNEKMPCKTWWLFLLFVILASFLKSLSPVAQKLNLIPPKWLHSIKRSFLSSDFLRESKFHFSVTDPQSVEWWYQQWSWVIGCKHSSLAEIDTKGITDSQSLCKFCFTNCAYIFCFHCNTWTQTHWLCTALYFVAWPSLLIMSPSGLHIVHLC